MSLYSQNKLKQKAFLTRVILTKSIFLLNCYFWLLQLLQSLVKEHFHKVNLRVAFKAPAELGDHFPFKDKVEQPKMQSGVVYRLKCKNCLDSYIGMTTRT